ncbi:HNH endonuclease [Candidatus Pacearchaeota archaeon]|nr:HNH endonuclease [Candidatus Pacearchaeota archaeon]
MNNPVRKESHKNQIRDLWNNKNSKYHSKEKKGKQSKSLKKVWSDANSGLNSPQHHKRISASKRELARDPNCYYHSKEFKEKQRKNSTMSLQTIREKYPFFCIVEDLKEDVKIKQIYGHCKNIKCKNSKENGGWFVLTRSQIFERIRNLEKSGGSEGSYFYCSDQCKKECRIYGKTVTTLINEDLRNSDNLPALQYTSSEYHTWKQEVLKLDDHKCQYCENPAEHVHHIDPQKLAPGYTLDPINGISFCSDCHYEYGHKKGTECSTGNLAKVVCK